MTWPLRSCCSSSWTVALAAMSTRRRRTRRMRIRDPLTIATLAVAAWALIVGVVAGARLTGVPVALAASIEAGAAPAPPLEGTVRVDIPEGASSDRILDLLYGAGVAEDREALRTWLLYTGVGSELSAGRYDFALNTPPAEILRRLRAGPDRIERITFRAGLRTEEIGEILERARIFTAAQWNAAVANAVPREFMEGGDLLGYLLPDTYELEEDTTAASLLEAMLDRFEAQVTPDLIQEAADQGWSLYEVLTLASVVEREAVHPEEKPEVAAVFRNRLADGWALQADPTVQFAISLGPVNGQGSVLLYSWWKSELTLDDLAYDSPYNTYLYPGLMPGPIANPDIDSIRATIRPASSALFYFVASPACDGRHLFAETLDQHNANVEIFRASDCGN
ncbi:MAG: endolytic transglycosylase MltG [Chloroflexi bacterium]|nr:endolytic transglycosylase MltG [Chloroflexota bacterium]